ncbi:sigma-54 interaction domain-containing protein [Clostridium beijerinckii]|uniref:Sigma 54-interacting transcriptional regulator n=1 Tax=Clostridium beijerinckii TaxID=1520 RepID=A0AAW3WGC0_CLOBE|nr:sigma 54-interacting transcriptional regulator [Clostridium beijerinckii]MBC2460104.1 sigma 54-interacting transcriptional regulator [Clostridium beijerinckii]MBC2477599.1 sigma 54-interacting transcriptional regulator [Clostridium beijerinckii]NOV60511.1 PAS domain S-box-containing protein [Clostridium beijerinckii]NOV70711.1 PAS domain S-box-containing protein [Clostridium beijerinckii]NOW33629.1 PAS domain S-box-containing protein [Clostridium beijerinckii]
MVEITNWLRIILDSLHDGVLIADKDGIIKYTNPAYTRITEVSGEDIIEKPLSEVRTGSRLPHVIKTGEKLLRVPRKVGDAEYIVNMVPIVESNEIIGGISILNEITEIYKLTEQLNKSNLIISNLEKRVKSMNKVKYTFDDIICVDINSEETKKLSQKAARSESNILITGESGTGKELYANSIHAYSNRKNGPFVAVNCATFDSNLLESELFGYEDGAFTGAKKGGKEGLFELANGGTLFLDEVSELDYGLQAKLLRVLQENTIRRVSGLKEIHIDVRIIVATNKSLEKMIEENKFRKDLYYRIAIFPINIPPLRNRRQDIKPLVNNFINQMAYKIKRNIEISEEAVNLLYNYDWPGNIRELKNSIEFATNMTDDYIINPEHLPKIIQTEGIKKNIMKLKSLEEIIKDAEISVINEAITVYGDTVEGKKKAAKALGISLATLYNKLK